MIAHVAVFPIEELVPALTGAAALLVARVRAWR